MTVPVSVVILTANEASNLPGCLEAVCSFTDDVVVVDSGSTDRTCEIACQHGVRVYENAFEGFGAQRNWAIDHVPHRYDWILHLDADERPTAEFVKELAQLLSSPRNEAGFYVSNRRMLGERWLRHASGFPVYQVRLFHHARLRFENHGHGQREIATGALGYMKEPYLHYAFSKGSKDWFEKHARYAAAEATEYRKTAISWSQALAGWVAREPVVRRRSLKQLSMRMPCRALLRFGYTLFVKRAILDGRAGIAYARMLATYESMIQCYMDAASVGLKIEPDGVAREITANKVEQA